MKRIIPPAILILFFNYSYAQKKASPNYSDIITTKKVMMKYQDEADSLLIPVVSAQYPELKKALCDTSLFFGDKLDTVIRRYQTTGTGITFFNYQVTYANKDVVSLQLYYETMGAHPDNSQQWLNYNIHTGAAYTIDNEVNPDGLEWIYTSYKQLLKKRIADDEAGLDRDKIDSSYLDIYKDLNESADELTPEKLLKNFVFTPKGVIFTTDATLPHSAENFEPERDCLVPYDKLKPYKLPGAMVLK